MPTICHPLVQGLGLRATRLDECGVVVGGECGTVVHRQFVSVGMSDDVTAPENITQLDAQGNQIYSEQALPQLNFVSAEITIAKADPDLYEMMTGAPLVMDAAGNAVGNQDQTDTYGTANYGLEIWTKVGRTGACPPGGAEYGYILLPWLAKASIGDVTIENGAVNFVITALTQTGSGWGLGPYDVMNDVGGIPGPLVTPVAATGHRYRAITQVPPPADVCGCQPLVLESP